jgi:hypothetical protein
MKSDNGLDMPYDTESFAEKHGLTVRAAKVVLISNGPSKIACDAAARAFKEAVSMLSRSLQRD